MRLYLLLVSIILVIICVFGLNKILLDIYILVLTYLEKKHNLDQRIYFVGLLLHLLTTILLK